MYRIIGADGKEYGPVSAEQVRRWVAEGRALSSTQASAEATPAWKPLGAFPEFSHLFAPVAVPPVVLPALVPVSLAPRKTSVFAVLGFVLGLFSVTVGLCCYGIPFNLLGLVFSIIGLVQTSGQPQVYDGKGLAVGGLVLALLSLLLAVAILLFFGRGLAIHGLPPNLHRL